MQYQQNYYNPQPYPAYQQPQYGQPPQYGQIQPNPQFSYATNDIPEFQLIKRGKGIDERELSVITHAAYEALRNREDPLSDGIIRRVKQQIKGEWMAFASIADLKGFDFSLSIVTGNDFLCFIIKNFRFQVCRLRD